MIGVAQWRPQEVGRKEIGAARSTVVNGGGRSLENWMAGLDATRAMVENGMPSEELRAL